MLTPESLAGWYGKLPSLGDFASRRLPPEFVEPWDHWLAEGLAQWQSRDPEWLTHYLSGPSWRFVLAPGVITEAAWAGTLMPSVDRVGRYFPLCIAQPLAPWPLAPDTAQSLLDLLLRLDDLAVDAMQDDWPVEQLEAELARVGLWSGEPAAVPGALAEELTAVLQPGQSAWIYTDAQGAPRLHCQHGLPRAGDLFRLALGSA